MPDETYYKMMNDYGNDVKEKMETAYYIGRGHQFFGITPSFTSLISGSVKVEFYNTTDSLLATKQITSEEYKNLPNGKPSTELLIERFNIK